jgi:hypothetical protein
MSGDADGRRQLFADLERLDFTAVANHAEDCSDEDMPYAEATSIGREAIRTAFDLGLATLERLPTTIHELLEQGDTIMVEPSEAWDHPTGERAALRCTAVFKFAMD